MNRRLNLLASIVLLLTAVALFGDCAKANEPQTALEANDAPLIASISKDTLWRNRDGQTRTWFHPRACMMPDANGGTVALMTLQEIGGSDYFGPVHWSISTDLGKTWSDPEPIAALGRDPVSGREDDLKAAVCDVVPQYDPVSDSLLATESMNPIK